MMLKQLLCHACNKVDGRLFLMSSVVAVDVGGHKILNDGHLLQMIYHKRR